MNIPLGRVGLCLGEVGRVAGARLVRARLSDCPRYIHEDELRRHGRNEFLDCFERAHVTDTVDDDGGTGRPSRYTENGGAEVFPAHLLDERFTERLEVFSPLGDTACPSHATNEASEGCDLETQTVGDSHCERSLTACDAAAEAEDDVHDVQ